MLRFKILPAMAVLLCAAVLSTSQVSYGNTAADACQSKPGPSSPPHLHWYYRVDRANHRHCWFLHSEELRVHSSAGIPHVTPPDIAAQPVNPVGIGEPAALQNGYVRAVPAQANSAGLALPEAGSADTSRRDSPQIEFAARWPNLPKALRLDQSPLAVRTTSYVAEQLAPDNLEQMPNWSVTAVTGTPQEAADAPHPLPMLRSGALGLMLLVLFWGGLKFARQPNSPDSPVRRWRKLLRSAMARGSRSTWYRDFGLPTRAAMYPADEPDMDLQTLMDVLRRIDAGTDSSRPVAPFGSRTRAHLKSRRWSPEPRRQSHFSTRDFELQLRSLERKLTKRWAAVAEPPMQRVRAL